MQRYVGLLPGQGSPVSSWEVHHHRGCIITGGGITGEALRPGKALRTLQGGFI